MPPGTGHFDLLRQPATVVALGAHTVPPLRELERHELTLREALECAANLSQVGLAYVISGCRIVVIYRGGELHRAPFLPGWRPEQQLALPLN